MQKSYIYIDPNCDPAVNSDAFRILQDKPLWSPMPTANSDFTRQLTLPTKKLIKLNQPSEMKLIGNSDYKTTSSQWQVQTGSVFMTKNMDSINPTWIFWPLPFSFAQNSISAKKTHAPSTIQTSTNPDPTCIPQRKWSPSRWDRNAHHWVTLPGGFPVAKGGCTQN